MIKVAPSILSASFEKLGDEVNAVYEAGADLIHLDVMDGQFVPNITFGPDIIKSIPKKEGIELDAHLMIQEPEKNLHAFIESGVNRISIHVESTVHLHRLLSQIRNADIKPSVSLNPSTSLNSIEWVLEDVDMVLLMSVNPGFGGQKFISSTLRKIESLKEIITKRGLNVEIEVDGGVNKSNIKQLKDAGTDIVVAGSAVFNADNYVTAINELKI